MCPAFSFDTNTGERIGNLVDIRLKVGRRGIVSFDMEQAHGVLLELVRPGLASFEQNLTHGGTDNPRG